MRTHDVIQGSEAWLAQRLNTYNASDAPAMLGCSPYETRSQLIARLATGIVPEVDAATQGHFDDGHRFEALARPLAVEIIGEDLYPVSGSEDFGLDKPLAASLDGSTITDEIIWEHKSLNDKLRAVLPETGIGGFEVGARLPKLYRVQMEQQLAVSGAGKDLFTASKWELRDGEWVCVEARHCWYQSDPALRAEILAGWKQLAEDVKAYTPPSAAPVVVAKVIGKLPVVFDMRVEGKLVACNIEQFKPAALSYIAAISTTLSTDQDFVDADADAKFCRDSADKLELSIEQAMGQMGDINTALNAVREIAAAFDAKGLALEKLVKAEKERRKGEIAADGVAKFRTHMDGLATRLGGDYMPQIPVDFGGAIKGLRSLSSMEDAVATTLASAKIAANEMADRIDFNMKWLETNAIDYLHLFAIDKKTLVQKPHDDFKAVAENRISTEKARVQAEQDRIREEAAEKARKDLLADQAAAAAKTTIATAAQTTAPALVAAAQVVQQAAAPASTSAPATQQGTVRAPAVFGAVSAPAIQADTGARIKLGEITARLAPLNITADGLAELGFPHVATDKAAKLYRESDWPAICEALIQHITQVADLQPA